MENDVAQEQTGRFRLTVEKQRGRLVQQRSRKLRVTPDPLHHRPLEVSSQRHGCLPFLARRVLRVAHEEQEKVLCLRLRRAPEPNREHQPSTEHPEG
jgi:hypothetical protein